MKLGVKNTYFFTREKYILFYNGKTTDFFYKGKTTYFFTRKNTYFFTMEKLRTFFYKGKTTYFFTRKNYVLFYNGKTTDFFYKGKNTYFFTFKKKNGKNNKTLVFKNLRTFLYDRGPRVGGGGEEGEEKRPPVGKDINRPKNPNNSPPSRHEVARVKNTVFCSKNTDFFTCRIRKKFMASSFMTSHGGYDVMIHTLTS